MFWSMSFWAIDGMVATVSGTRSGEAWPHVALHELEEHRHELLGGFLEVREEEFVVGHPPTVRRSRIGDAAYFQGTAPPRRW